MRSKPRHPGSDFGFTVLEVMVAVMILAVSVVAIFGAQFAAVATTDFSQYTTQAIELARCRMSEIELQIQTENGFEEGDVVSSGDCCEMLEGEANIADFSCAWEIKTIELPDLTSIMTGGADGGGLFDDMGLGGGLTGDSMGSSMDESAGGSWNDFAAMEMASSFAPMLSEMLSQAIRRVTVTVEWEQGSKKREFVLAQYLTHPTQGPLELMQAAATAGELSEAAEEEGLMPSEGPGSIDEGSPQGKPANRPMDGQTDRWQ